MGDGWDGFGESVRLCVHPCPLWDTNPGPLWENSLCGHILLNLGYWYFKLHLVNMMLIIN
jgi:hypothetical protein